MVHISVAQPTSPVTSLRGEYRRQGGGQFYFDWNPWNFCCPIGVSRSRLRLTFRRPELVVNVYMYNP
jgi:hypothetical protein